MSDLRQKHEETYRKSRRFARECALQGLYQMDVSDWDEPREIFGHFWQQLEAETEFEKPFEPAGVQKFVKRLVFGVVDNREELDQKLTAYAQHWSLSRMAIIDRNILRLAAYEILHCTDIPPVASVNEAIELAKHFGDKDSPKFVNGILDNFVQTLKEQNDR